MSSAVDVVTAPLRIIPGVKNVVEAILPEKKRKKRRPKPAPKRAPKPAPAKPKPRAIRTPPPETIERRPQPQVPTRVTFGTRRTVLRGRGRTGLSTTESEGNVLSQGPLERKRTLGR